MHKYEEIFKTALAFTLGGKNVNYEENNIREIFNDNVMTLEDWDNFDKYYKMKHYYKKYYRDLAYEWMAQYLRSIGVYEDKINSILFMLNVEV